MHLLAREEAGLRCLCEVAGYHDRGPRSIASIAHAQALTPEYVAKLMRRLRLGGLVRSTRGAAGGYRLTRPPNAISVWDAVRVLDDSFLPDRSCDCDPEQRPGCRRTAQCAIQTLWRQLGDRVRETLAGVTLEDLCGRAASGEQILLDVVPSAPARGATKGVIEWTSSS